MLPELLDVKSASPSPARKILASMEDSAFPLVTMCSASAQLDSLDVVARSTSMSVHQPLVTMEELARICLRATAVSALQDTQV